MFVKALMFLSKNDIIVVLYFAYAGILDQSFLRTKVKRCI